MLFFACLLVDDVTVVSISVSPVLVALSDHLHGSLQLWQIVAAQCCAWQDCRSGPCSRARARAREVLTKTVLEHGYTRCRTHPAERAAQIDSSSIPGSLSSMRLATALRRRQRTLKTRARAARLVASRRWRRVAGARVAQLLVALLLVGSPRAAHVVDCARAGGSTWRRPFTATARR